MLTACHLRRISVGVCFGAAVLMPAFMASAQPLSIDVGPSSVGRAEYTPRGWMIMPAQDFTGADQATIRQAAIALGLAASCQIGSR
jgi:hypothetical protein